MNNIMILAAALINFVESVHDGIVPPPDSLEFYSEFKAECEKVGINLRDESLVNLEINDEPETLTFEYLLQFPFEIEGIADDESEDSNAFDHEKWRTELMGYLTRAFEKVQN